MSMLKNHDFASKWGKVRTVNFKVPLPVDHEYLQPRHLTSQSPHRHRQCAICSIIASVDVITCWLAALPIASATDQSRLAG